MFTIRKARPYIEMLRSQLGEPKRAAEVGVWKGEFSAILLDHFPNLHLLMVDCYKRYEKDSEDFRMKKKGQQDFYDAMMTAVDFTSPHADRRIVMVGDSLEVCQEIKPASLDFVFIDADHCYTSCSADIKAWYPKVRKGGVVSGHDYSRLHPGVRRAVDEFCGDHKYRLRRLTQCIWWVKKND